MPPEQGSEDDVEFTITSVQASVASAAIECWNCRANIDVICIYCESGNVSGEPLTQFTVSHIWGIDSALARQLERWPLFRQVQSVDEEGGCFANHCPHCGSVQEDLYLHSEPGDPFFDIPHAAPGTIKWTALAGQVRLSGDESFAV